MTIFEIILLIIVLALLAVLVYLRGRQVKLDTLLAEKSAQTTALEQRVAASDEALSQARQQAAVWSERAKLLEERLQAKADDDEQQRLHFAALAEQVLKAKSGELLKHNEDALSPLREDLKRFKERVEQVYSNESRERFSLGKQIEQLVAQSSRLGEDASNLTRALKGDSKVQGDWGEMVLSTILEQSGLVEGREYELQTTLRNEAGQLLRHEETQQTMRPDAIVHYPGNKLVIIDSKVNLTDYTNYLAAENPQDQKHYATLHLQRMRKHIDELASKAYHQYSHKSLDFVMMFVPIEPAYILAMQQDANLWSYAYQRHVLILNPNNLVTALKLTFDLWSREKQTINVEKVIKQATSLYDKFCGFVSSFDDAINYMDKAADRMTQARNQLSEGRGNIFVQMNKLKAMGITPKKQLPLTDAESDDEGYDVSVDEPQKEDN